MMIVFERQISWQQVLFRKDCLPLHNLWSNLTLDNQVFCILLQVMASFYQKDKDKINRILIVTARVIGYMKRFTGK